MKDSSY